MVSWLPHVNASLNACAAVLLLIGYWQIKRGRVTAHKWLMLAAFVVSTVFLVCYLVYHYQVGSKPFPKDVAPAIRIFYLLVLLSHVVLAMAVPPLALTSIYLGLRKPKSHRAVAVWTWPIWLYVSLTGVVVYVMLYHLFAR